MERWTRGSLKIFRFLYFSLFLQILFSLFVSFALSSSPSLLIAEIAAIFPHPSLPRSPPQNPPLRPTSTLSQLPLLLFSPFSPFSFPSRLLQISFPEPPQAPYQRGLGNFGSSHTELVTRFFISTIHSVLRRFHSTIPARDCQHHLTTLFPVHQTIQTLIPPSRSQNLEPWRKCRFSFSRSSSSLRLMDFSLRFAFY